MEVIFLNSNNLTENVEPIVKRFEKWGSQLSWPETPHAINSLGKTVITHLIYSLRITFTWHQNYFSETDIILKCYKTGAWSDCALCRYTQGLAPALAPSLQAATIQETVKQEKA